MRCSARRTRSAQVSPALQKAGVAYVLLTVAGGSAQLRRFAGEIMPTFAGSTPVADAAE